MLKFIIYVKIYHAKTCNITFTTHIYVYTILNIIIIIFQYYMRFITSQHKMVYHIIIIIKLL